MKGLEALEVAILMAVVTFLAAAVFNMVRNVRSPEVSSAIMSVDAIANSSIYNEVKSSFSRSVIVSNVSGSLVTYVEAARVVEAPSKGNLVVVGRVLVGKALLRGVKVIDMRNGEVAGITLLKNPVLVEAGDVVLINVSLPKLSKFYKVEFVGNGIRTVDS